MPFPKHPQTLFHLVPNPDNNEGALKCQNDTENRPHVSQTDGGRWGLEIGPHIANRINTGTIAELGRNGKPVIRDSGISRHHISFEIHPQSFELMLCNLSSNPGATAIVPRGFREDGNFRKMVMQTNVEYVITVRGEENTYEWVVIWSATTADVLEATVRQYQATRDLSRSERHARTVETGAATIPIYYSTRLVTPANQVGLRLERINGLLEDALGSGTSGTVKKVLDLDSGRHLAAKRVTNKQNALREVKTLSRLNHANIVQLLGHQDGGENEIIILMSLEDGNLQGLLTVEPALRSKPPFLDALFSQMLNALDYLAVHCFIHRDVKPTNILHTSQGSGRTFKLADFGVATLRTAEFSQCGTELYQPPEIFFRKSTDMKRWDVWSLAVVMGMVTTAGGLTESIPTYQDLLQGVRGLTSRYPEIAPMTREEPTQRATAAQMLITAYGGVGLSSPRRRIKPIPDASPNPAPLQSPAAAELTRQMQQARYPHG